MRKSIATLLKLIVVATFALAALTVAADNHKVRGTIVTVDLATSSLTVKTANMQNATCIVDAQTNITIRGKTAALVDLKVGQNAALEVQAGKALTIVVNEG
jgi:hypothetical protein